MRPFFALLAMLGFAVAAVLGPLPTTRAGLQCPTATVQTIAARDCCGRLVPRAPRPGEKGFKQCRCQEKRQGALQAGGSPRNEALPPARLAFEVPTTPPSAWSPPTYAARMAAWSFPPPVRPPSTS